MAKKQKTKKQKVTSRKLTETDNRKMIHTKKKKLQKGLKKFKSNQI